MMKLRDVKREDVIRTEAGRCAGTAARTLGLLMLLLVGCGGDNRATSSDDGTPVVPVTNGENAMDAAEAARLGGFDLDDLPGTDEALPEVDSLVIPPHDFTTASTETEPNDDPETATSLGPDHALQGQLAGREDDYVRLDVEGEPQLWWIEATGETISHLYHHTTAGRAASGAPTERDGNTWTLTNLFLLPGTHWFSVGSRGGDAPYTFRAVPLGPPDPHAEHEPNDDASRAHLLRFGAPRTGYFFEENDTDQYRFTLSAETFVQLEVAPPAGVTLEVRLNDGPKGTTFLSGTVPGDGSSFTYDALLPAGLYGVALRAREGRSNTPYAIRLNRRDPFNLPADLEPNDHAASARPLPSNFTIQGTVGDFRDEDWYRLPELTGETTLTITPKAGTPRHLVDLFEEGGRSPLRALTWDDARGALTGTVSGDVPLLVRLRGESAYTFRFAFDPGPQPTTRGGALPVSVALSEGPHVVAAYWNEGQRLPLAVTFENQGSAALDLILDATASHHAWTPRLDQTTLSLAPGQSARVPVTVIIPPDAWDDQPVHVTVGAKGANGAVAAGAALVHAVCGAPPVNPHRTWPLPDQLLGGLNLASTALGGTYTVDDPTGRRREDLYAHLFDGVTPNNAGWKETLPASVTIDLAGDAAIPIAGVLLHPKTPGRPAEQVKDFTVSVSTDGQTFSPVLDGTLERQPVEQAFVFDQPVEARFVRVELRSNYAGAAYAGATVHGQLGEIKVVAAPDAYPFPATGFNLADPDNGGHVVWSRPLIDRPPAQILTADDTGVRLPLDPTNPNVWVVGFHHQRAAQLRELQWVQSTSEQGGDLPHMTKVQVSVSTESPVGPWVPVGAWTLDAAPGSTSALTLAEPVWARYVRFVNTEPTAPTTYRLPATIRIFERPVDASYRSILGEWGHYAQPAIYEQITSETALSGARAENDENDTRDDAERLRFGDAVDGQVVVGTDVDWYRLDVPGPDNRLRLDLSGDPTLRAIVALVDAKGNEILLEEVTDPTTGTTALEAIVEPGATYHLRLEEPLRSIAFVWDNSGSVQPYYATIYQTMGQFASGLQPGREYANLLPFQSSGGSFLLDTWADQPYLLQQAVNNYARNDASSDAETALLKATTELAERDGTKAVILLTDAATYSYQATDALWTMLDAVRPRIFTLELHAGDVASQQDLMQSWAAVGGGHYDYFETNADLDVGFRRASCRIRRPARYTLVATTRHEAPPSPGQLAVTMDETTPINAVELILDASGSMLQRLNGKRRIAIARDVLTDLVSNTLAEGTPLALRIFGHKTPDACQTDLDVPLAPLDRDRVVSVIQATEAKNLAKTPIGASLRLVAEDLRTADGQKLILLITDGEETCDGDPAAAIQALKDQGLDVRVNIIGFAIDDAALKADFERWAEAGGGRYFDAADEADLAASVRQALKPKFQVIDAGGTIVAAGTVGDAAVELPAGAYTVKVLTSPLQVFDDVTVTPERETVVTAGSDTKGGV